MTALHESEKLIEALGAHGLLTEDQSRRVRQAVESGKDLVWALSHLPLVEPLQFLKAQAGLSQQTHPASPASSPGKPVAPMEGKPRPARVDTPTPVPVSLGLQREPLDSEDSELELDSVLTLDIEDKDYAAGFEGVGRPVGSSPAIEESAPQTPSPVPPTPRPRRPPPPPSSSASTVVVPSPEAYARPGIAPPTYDLDDDEGIPLVNRVNALLAEAFGNGVRRLVIRDAGEGMEVSSISEYGTEGLTQPLDREEGAKICNRLKIMARIEPWRKPPQKGMYLVHHTRRQARALVDVAEGAGGPGTEEIVVHLLPS